MPDRKRVMRTKKVRWGLCVCLCEGCTESGVAYNFALLAYNTAALGYIYIYMNILIVMIIEIVQLRSSFL